MKGGLRCCGVDFHRKPAGESLLTECRNQAVSGHVLCHRCLGNVPGVLGLVRLLGPNWADRLRHETGQACEDAGEPYNRNTKKRITEATRHTAWAVELYSGQTGFGRKPAPADLGSGRHRTARQPLGSVPFQPSTDREDP